MFKWMKSKENVNNVKAITSWSYAVKTEPTFIWIIFVLEGDGILLEKKIVSSNEEDAKVKAGVYELLQMKNILPSQVRIITRKIFDLSEGNS